MNYNAKRLSQLFEHAPEAITILDVTSLKFTDYNINALEMLKLAPEKMYSTGPLEISPEFQPDGRRSDEKARQLINEALNGDKPVFEWLVVDGKGEKILCEVRLTSIAGSGKPQLYASFINIMAKKKTEELLRQHNQKLSEIAVLQSHQVRQPVSNILGLFSLFNFKNHQDPINAEVLNKLEMVAKNFDSIIHEIVSKSQVNDTLDFGCKHIGNRRICNPGPACSAVGSCFSSRHSVN